MFDQVNHSGEDADFRSLLDGSGDAIVISGPDGSITYVNAAAERLWGHSLADMKGRKITSLIASNVRNTYDGWIDRNGHPSDSAAGSVHEVLIERKDGAKLWVGATLSHYYDGQRRKHQAAFLRDITGMRESRSVLEQTLEHAKDAVVAIDQDNNVLSYNLAAERLWGYSKRDVIGQNVKMLVPPDMRSKHDGFVDHHRQTGENRVVGTSRSVPIHCKDGTVKRGTLKLSQVVLDNGDKRYTAFIRDTTEADKLTDDTLLAMQDMLEKIEELTRQIYSVAQQTNLLSINATIEASRAGEAGRGFGVVAQEIRTLSNQVRDVTSRIKDVVGEGHASVEKLKLNNDP